MRRLLTACLCGFLAVVLSGCVTGTSGLMDRLMGPQDLRYSVTERYFEQLDGNFNTYSVDIYKDYFDTVRLTWFDSESGQDFLMIEVEYQGTDWRFMDGEVLAEVDGALHTLPGMTDRDVVSGGVRETITVVLPPEQAMTLRNITSLRLQYFGDITDIEYVAFVRRFADEVIAAHQ